MSCKWVQKKPRVVNRTRHTARLCNFKAFVWWLISSSTTTSGRSVRDMRAVEFCGRWTSTTDNDAYNSVLWSSTWCQTHPCYRLEVGWKASACLRSSWEFLRSGSKALGPNHETYYKGQENTVMIDVAAHYWPAVSCAVDHQFITIWLAGGFFTISQPRFQLRFHPHISAGRKTG